MKQEPNKEMDLLLRKLGRAAASSARPEEMHLDTDELNAYAEKALPPAAYARYTKHIADCTQCRNIVSDLAVATGVIIEASAKKPETSPSGFKAFWTSLFSPLVLRYSVPALAIAIVATVGFMMLRNSNVPQVASTNERTQDSVAQTQSSPQAAVRGVVDPTKSATRGETASPSTPSVKAEEPKENKPSADDERQPKDAKPDQPVVANEPVAATAAPPPPASVKAGNADVQPAPKPSVVAQPERRVDEITATDSDAVAKQADKTAQKGSEADKKAAPKVTSVGGFGVAGSRPAKEPVKEKTEATRSRANSREAGETKSEVRDESETRSVAGRRFRREGSAWIDVAYSSQATTVVARGSEQYRALVADEPGIKTIAEQLSGQVIVVWKGRAYKIR
jgi:hypothetical protein